MLWDMSSAEEATRREKKGENGCNSVATLMTGFLQKLTQIRKEAAKRKAASETIPVPTPTLHTQQLTQRQPTISIEKKRVRTVHLIR